MTTTLTDPDLTTRLLRVDHSIPFAQALSHAVGPAGECHPEFTAERFPLTGSGVIEYETRYLYLNRKYSPHDIESFVLRKIDTAYPWLFAETGHLLGFAKEYSDEYRKHRILAMGSTTIIRGFARMPCVAKFGNGPQIDLSWLDDTLDNGEQPYRILLVRPRRY